MGKEEEALILGSLYTQVLHVILSIMRLNIVLQFLNKKVKIPGNRFNGKHRLYPKVTKMDINQLKSRLRVEENNMLLLRNPFLSLEQSWGHAQDLGKHEQWIHKKYLEKHMEKVQKRPPVTLEERYATLERADDWDQYTFSK